ncbi:MAG: hypothetical protein ABR512_07105 [Desulfopila sp.]
MCGLAHYIEEEGLPTTLISLIREHSEKMRPPRALWVPFDLGRPFGAPREGVFQKDVLKSVLSLLQYEKGPVLEDYPHEAPDGAGQPTEVACPVNFAPPKAEPGSMEELLQSFRAEIGKMRTWHELAQQQTQRSTTGVSGLEPETIADLFEDFLGGRQPDIKANVQLSDLLRMATEDIKALYCEAIAAQPGQSSAVTSLSNWFWGQTAAALVINEVRLRCLESEKKDLLLAGKLLLVPRNQLHRFMNP